MTIVDDSPLYVPANRDRLMARARAHPGSVILDLEDSVAPRNKAEALRATRAFLEDPRPFETWIRIESGRDGVEQLAAVRDMPGLDGVWVPKVEEIDQVRAVAELVGDHLEIGLLIESAKGLLEIGTLIGAEGATAVQLGEIDLAADLHQPEPHLEGMGWARNWVRVHAAASGRALVGPADPNYTDLDAFRESCLSLRTLGYPARACIHPSQCEVADQVFRAGDEDVRRSQELLDAYERAAADGAGAFGANGSMVDAATARIAEGIVARARRANVSRPNPPPD